MKLPDISLFKGWPTLQPEFATAGAPAPFQPRSTRPDPASGIMQFASNGGNNNDDGDGFDDGYDDDLVYEEPAPQQTRRAPGAQRNAKAAAAGSGGGRGGAGGGRPRTVQYQPEERYWTEYLRIALPILGLLLMIGLLWFWALQLMDDDSNGGDPVVTETPVVTEVVNVPESTPTTEATEEIIAPPTATPTEESTPEAPPEEETPEETTGGGEIAIDAVVELNENEVNMRSEPTTASDVVEVLSLGDQFTVADGPVEADGNTWWLVVNEDSSVTGWVSGTFLDVVP